MIISVHLPKTAGSSFLSSLNQHFGATLLKDYGDFPLHKNNFNRNKHAISYSASNYLNDYHGIECIHGHFLPLKYRYYKSHPERQFITWMRDPVERLASQYHYMMRNYTVEKLDKQPLLKKMIDEEWTLERFCLGKELRNTYSKFLWGFPLKQFNFIGIVEHYDSELAYFSDKFIGKALVPYQKNKNPLPQPDSYFNDLKLKSEVEKYHAKDIKLYQTALQLRHARL